MPFLDHGGDHTICQISQRVFNIFQWVLFYQLDNHLSYTYTENWTSNLIFHLCSFLGPQQFLCKKFQIFRENLNFEL